MPTEYKCPLCPAVFVKKVCGLSPERQFLNHKGYHLLAGDKWPDEPEEDQVPAV